MLRADGPAAFRDVGETEFARGVAAMSASGQYGKVKVCAAIVGFVDFRLVDDVARVLDAHEEAAGGRFRGIRQIAPWVSGELAKAMPLNAPEALLRDPDFRKGFAHLRSRNLTFDAWLFHPQLGDVVDLARAFPDTRIVVNHLGGRLGIGPYAFRFDEEFRNWRQSLAELARLPNVYMKIGGLGMLYGGFTFHTGDRPPTSIELAKAWGPFILAGIEAFGPQRCMMESNFPVDMQSCSFPVLWNTLKRVTADFSAAEKAALFHGTAQDFYRLGPIVG
jgi:predicted TIM-barrel fold metal-dependent hydrolase